MTRAPVRLDPDDLRYPAALRSLAKGPPVLFVDGDLRPAHRVAVVGSRACSWEARAFTRLLAEAVVSRGGVVVSGGALGIDAAAHEGALAARGRTWAVLPNGHFHATPPAHAQLFDTIRGEGGACLWPFEPHVRATFGQFYFRNEVLVALADVVVVVQAGEPSGALNTAMHARAHGKPLWVVPAAPWVEGFEGCRKELERGALPLTSLERFVNETFAPHDAHQLPLRHGFDGARLASKSDITTRTARPRQPTTSTHLSGKMDLASANGGPNGGPNPLRQRLNTEELLVVDAIGGIPTHLDDLVVRTGLPIARLRPVLLTLVLENVVVEGPDGFFRRP